MASQMSIKSICNLQFDVLCIAQPNRPLLALSVDSSCRGVGAVLRKGGGCQTIFREINKLLRHRRNWALARRHLAMPWLIHHRRRTLTRLWRWSVQNGALPSCSGVADLAELNVACCQSG